MKRLLYLLSIAILAFGCVEPIDDTPKTGDIIGSVSDKSTGEPISTVITTLTPGGKKSVTGSDGTFEYKDLEPGKYTIEIEKEGYKTASGEFSVTAGKQSPAHMLLERIPVVITPDRDILDFGESDDVNTLSFSIVNSGYEDLKWSIEHDCKWIKNIKLPEGTLPYGKTETIIVSIDRDKLNLGENEAVIVVVSTHGRAELKVKAIGVDRTVLIPDCELLDFGDSEGVNKLSFSMTNSGRTDLKWSVEHDCKWITDVNPPSGTLEIGEKKTIVITIDRSKLNLGANESILVIRSTNGRAELKVKATGVDKTVLVPDCEILDFGESEGVDKLSFSMINTGRADLDWNVEEDCKWISNVSPSFGNLKIGEKKTIVVTIDRANLNLGTNETVLVISSTNGRAELKVKAVGVDKTILVPDIETLDFGESEDVNKLSFSMINTGRADLGWSIEQDCKWISDVSPKEGTLEIGVKETVVVTIDRSKLNLGTNETILVIRSTNGRAELKIKATGTDKTVLVPDVETLDFGESDGVNKLSFSMSNSGRTDLKWSVDHDCKWITSVTPPSGTLNVGAKETIVVTIDRAKLDIGANETILVVRSTNGRAELKVKATGVDKTVLVPDVETLDFGESDGVNKLSFNMTNSGRADLDWSIEYDCKWISNVSPVSGTLSVGVKGTVVVSIDRTKLDAGDNATVLIIRSTNGSAELKVTAFGMALPSLNMLSVSDIYSTSAIFKGELIEDGTPKYTERGFVYSTNSYPTLESTIEKLTVPVTSDNIFSVGVSQLTVGTKYYVRSYAINKAGVAYSSNEVSFTPIQHLPIVETNAPSNIVISTGKVTFNGNVTYLGDPAYTEHGFVYGQVHNPTIDDDTKKVVSGKSEGVFSANISDLSMNTIYYVRAFATNELGTAYGEEKSVDMSQIMPKVTTKAVKNITAVSATLCASLDSVGDPALSERGFIYGTMPVPTLDLPGTTKKTVAGSATGDYTSHISGLADGTTYYVRAYAIAAGKVSYGNIVEFKAQEPQYVVLQAANIMVQKEDIGRGDFSSVNSMCNSSIVSDYDDWRLPTIDELVILYNNRNEIGGFYTQGDYNESIKYYPFIYWSSSSGRNSYGDISSSIKYVLSFNNGNQTTTRTSNNEKLSGRCVRTIE